MTHQPTAQKRRRRRRNDKWAIAQYGHALVSEMNVIVNEIIAMTPPPPDDCVYVVHLPRRVWENVEP